MPESHIRIGDSDRDRVAEQLQEHFAAGRLSEPELQERLDTTYAARTFGDLSPVLADLPALPTQGTRPAPRPSAGVEPVLETGAAPARRSKSRTALRAGWAAWAAAVSVNLVIWLLVSLSNGELAYFWPMWVAGPWGAVLLASTFAQRLASGGDHDRYRRSIEHERRRGRDELQ